MQWFVDDMITLADNVKERRRVLDDVLRDEYRHFMWDHVPTACYTENADKVTVITTAMSKADIKRAWKDLREYITREYFQKSQRRGIDNEITRATLFKFIKNTIYGPRVDELGVEGSTRSNLMKGFMSESAYRVVLKALSNRPLHDSILSTFGTVQKIEFIYTKLKEVEMLK